MLPTNQITARIEWYFVLNATENVNRFLVPLARLLATAAFGRFCCVSLEGLSVLTTGHLHRFVRAPVRIQHDEHHQIYCVSPISFWLFSLRECLNQRGPG